MVVLVTTIFLAFFTNFKRSLEKTEVVSLNVITPIITEQDGGVALSGRYE
jgi:hypothetical protein